MDAKNSKNRRLKPIVYVNPGFVLFLKDQSVNTITIYWEYDYDDEILTSIHIVYLTKKGWTKTLDSKISVDDDIICLVHKIINDLPRGDETIILGSTSFFISKGKFEVEKDDYTSKYDDVNNAHESEKIYYEGLIKLE